MVAGGTYLAQLCYAREKSIKIGIVPHMLMVILGIASYGAFIWGLVEAYDAIKTGLRNNGAG